MNVAQFAYGTQKSLANTAMASLDAANATIERQNALFREWEAALAEREATIKRLEAQVASLDLKLKVKTAHAAGLTAQLDRYKSVHVDSPLMAPSGKKTKDGKAKSVGRIAYEEAFDRFGQEQRIPDFSKYRAD